MGFFSKMKSSISFALFTLAITFACSSAFLLSPPSPQFSNTNTRMRSKVLSMSEGTKGEEVNAFNHLQQLAGKGLLSLSALTLPFLPFPSPSPISPAANAAISSMTSIVTSAEEEVKQGLYKEYTVEKNTQSRDNAASTFKSKEETGENRNKYVAVLGVLLLGSAVIPMAQYYWYVKEEAE